MLELTTVYLGLGSNIGAADKTVASAFELIQNLDCVANLRISRFYLSKPTKVNSQASFVNAVCTFETATPADVLFSHLEDIEKALGKVPKPKNASRPIDIDILFYGNKIFDDGNLIIPHSKWQERLFVLVPLLDLTSTITVAKQDCPKELQTYDLQNFINSFSKQGHDEIKLLETLFNCGETCTA